jgi:hypothetical protein
MGQIAAALHGIVVHHTGDLRTLFRGFIRAVELLARPGEVEEGEDRLSNDCGIHRLSS